MPRRKCQKSNDIKGSTHGTSFVVWLGPVWRFNQNNWSLVVISMLSGVSRKIIDQFLSGITKFAHYIMCPALQTLGTLAGVRSAFIQGNTIDFQGSHASLAGTYFGLDTVQAD